MGSDPIVPLPGWECEALDSATVLRWLERGAGPAGFLLEVADSAVEFWDTYYDTADWRFHRAGVSLRVREGGGRAEVNARRRGHERGPADLPVALARHHVREIAACAGPVGARIRAVAGTRTMGRQVVLQRRRESLRLARGGHPVATIRLEDVRVPWATRDPLRLSRVQVRVLVAGEPGLDAFLGEFRTTCTLLAAPQSPYERALVAFGLAPPGFELGPTEFTAEGTAAAAATAILRRHAADLLAREASTRLGEDPEELHQMRVALRRMRSTLRTFRDLLPPQVIALRPKLGWLGRALGRVRDLDVRLAQIGEWTAALEPADAEALNVVRMSLASDHDQARSALLEALDSSRYERLVQLATSVLRAAPVDAPPAGCVPLARIAPELLRSAARRVRRRVRRLDADAGDAEFHEARIRIKELRYALDALAPLYGRSAVRFLRRVEPLQSLLGEQQDARTALAWLRASVEDESTDLPRRTIFVIGRIAERQAARIAETRAAAPALFARLKGRRWKRLLRSLTEAEGASLPPPAPPPAALKGV